MPGRTCVLTDDDLGDVCGYFGWGLTRLEVLLFFFGPVLLKSGSDIPGITLVRNFTVLNKYSRQGSTVTVKDPKRSSRFFRRR